MGAPAQAPMLIQEQMVRRIESPSPRVSELVELLVSYWWLGAIMLVGVIVTGVICWRVFLHTNNQFIVEFRRLIGIRGRDKKRTR